MICHDTRETFKSGDEERSSHTGRRPPDRRSEGLQRSSGLPGVHSQICRPGCAPGGGLFQGNCSRVGTRPLLETSVLRGSGSTPLGDVVPDSVLLHGVGVATPPTSSRRQETVHPRGHPARIVATRRSAETQVSRPARTASLIRAPSAAPRTIASPACESQRPTPAAPPWAYAVSAPR